MSAARLLMVAVFALLPAQALAALTPYVGKGPAITGVTQTEAWVAWYTLHHQGDGFQCKMEGNTNLPTLTLSSSVATSTAQDSNCSRYHKVHLTGLTPGTHYTFSLDMGYDASTPATGEFTTAPAGPKSFDFIVYGDNRDDRVGATSTRADHQAAVDAILAREHPAFLLHTGDFALNIAAVSGDDNGYTEFFDVERPLIRALPLYSVFGNHESIDSTFYDGLLSAQKLANAANPYYTSLDWGQVHVVLLNSFEGPSNLTQLGAHDPLLSDAQAAWADADMAAAKAAGKLIFVLSHQGAFSYGTGAHGGSPDVQSKIIPLMLKYGALAVFGGHDHYYQRGHEGCVDYMVVGGGGAPMYDPDPGAAGVIKAAKIISYMVVHIAGSSASAEVKDTQGNVIDSITFTQASCNPPPPPDAGQPAVDASQPAGPDASTSTDSGLPGPDSGNGATLDAGTSGNAAGGAPVGCSCSSSGSFPVLGLGLLGLALQRRRR